MPALIEQEPTRLYVIVSYDHDVVTLYAVRQETYPITSQSLDHNEVTPRARVILRNGNICIQTEQGVFSMTGAAE